MKSTNHRVTGFLRGLVRVLLPAAICSNGVAYSTSEIPAAAAAEPLVPTAAFDAHRKHQIFFEPNRGQTDAQIDFVARGAGYTAFLSSKELILALHAQRERAVVRMALADANPSPRGTGSRQLPGSVNYAKAGNAGKRITVPTYAQVDYEEVYPGIGLTYHGRQGQLEYDFVVMPGADPRVIRLAFAGVSAVHVERDGALLLDTAIGQVRKPRPVIYQEIDGRRQAVAGHYVVDEDDRVGFAVGSYDTTHTLVIDPLLVYSSYLGGHGDETVAGIAVDAAGNLYVTGITTSVDFPATTAGAQDDVFVTKFNAAGGRMYSTYLGTPCDDSAGGIAVDASGSAYVTGRAWEGWCSSDPPGPAYPGIFVAKLDPAGAQDYFFFFGPQTFDSSHGRAIAVDNAGAAYITGVTSPSSPGFPTTSGAFRPVPCPAGVLDNSDGFVAKVNPAGTALVYSTYLCGSGHDSPNAIAIDAAGNAYVAGSTHSLDFPTRNAFQSSNRAAPYGLSAFVTKLDASGSALLYSTYLGGSDDTGAQGLALDALGQAHVTGYTTATDFPTTADVVQPTAGSRACLNGPCTDAFVTKLSTDGTGLMYSTYLFGDFHDSGVGIAVDGTGHAYVTGTTYSSNFPIVQAFQPQHGELGPDAFVTKLNPTGTAIVYSSYLGGHNVHGQLLEGEDEGLGIAVDGSGNAYVGGYTSSFNFPTTANAFQRTLAEGSCGTLGYLCADAFVTRISAGGPGVTPALRVSVTPASPAAGSKITATWAGLLSPGSDDELRLYRLGAIYHDYVASWPTTGAASGASNLQLPGAATDGWYEVRLLSPDSDRFLAVVARSDAFRIVAGTEATLDADDSITASKYDALTDGLLIIRYLFGLSGTSLTAGALSSTAARTDPAAIKAYLDSIHTSLDIDGNGTADALTDGLLLIRYLFGLRGNSLIAGAVDPLATRKTAQDIETYIQSLMP